MFLAFFIIEAREALLLYNIMIILATAVFPGLALSFETFGFDTLAVEPNHLKGPFTIYRHQVCRDGLIGRVCNLTLENIGLEEVIDIIFRFEFYLFRRYLLPSLYIRIYLEVEATFQLGALSGKLLGIERYILIARGTRCHRHEIGHPFRAAQFASARPYTAYAAGFLTHSYLLHLDTHFEDVGKHLYQLPEIDTVLGYIIEYRLISIALILYVAYLHIEAQILGDFAGLYHRIVLAGLGLLIFLYIIGLCLAIHSFQLGLMFRGMFAHLQRHQPPYQRYLAYVMTGRRLYGNDIAHLQLQVRRIAIVSLARILEAYLYQIALLLRLGQVGKPVGKVELRFAPPIFTGIEVALLYIVIDVIVHAFHRFTLQS